MGKAAGAGGEAGSSPRERWSFEDFKRGRKESKGLSYGEMVKWVLDRVDVHGGELEPGDAPSAGAWSMLQWVRESEANRRTFFTSMVARAGGREKEGESVGERLERRRLASQEKMVERVRRVYSAAGIQAVAEDPFTKS